MFRTDPRPENGTVFYDVYARCCPVDGDGEREVVTSGGAVPEPQVYDLRSDTWDCYTLDGETAMDHPVEISPEEGVVIRDDEGAVLARYLLEENCLMRQEPSA